MAKVIKCESCGKKKEVSDATFTRWMNDKQFFCEDCKEDLNLEDDYSIA